MSYASKFSVHIEKVSIILEIYLGNTVLDTIARWRCIHYTTTSLVELSYLGSTLVGTQNPDMCQLFMEIHQTNTYISSIQPSCI